MDSCCACPRWHQVRKKKAVATPFVHFDINDPSHSISGEYWQMGTAKNLPDFLEWQQTANCIHQGLPVDEKKLFQQSEAVTRPQFWGCLRDNVSFWVYRIFLTGRDAQGRPGRYFFVLFHSSSPALLAQSGVVNVLNYLASQSSIPLMLDEISGINPCETATTDERFPAEENSGIPMELALAIKHSEDVPAGSHFGLVIDGGTLLRKHPDLGFPISSKPDFGSPPNHFPRPILPPKSRDASVEKTSKNQDAGKPRKPPIAVMLLVIIAALLLILIVLVIIFALNPPPRPPVPPEAEPKASPSNSAKPREVGVPSQTERQRERPASEATDGDALPETVGDTPSAE